MKNIKDKITGHNAKPQEFDAICYGIKDIIESGYKANDIYNPNEHEALITTYLGAMEKLENISFLKKGKQKKLCAKLKADIEDQNETFRTVYDSILGIEPVSAKKEDSTTYAKKLQNVYSTVKDTASTVIDVPRSSAENLKIKALDNPKRVYFAGLIGLFGARTVGAMLTQDTSSLNDSLYDFDNLTSVVLNEASTSGSLTGAEIYTGDLTTDLSIADNWENVITHPDFTATEDFEDAFRRLYSIDASEISNLPEELQERLKEIQDIYAQNQLVDTPIAETLGEGPLVEYGKDGKDVYTPTPENIDELVEKTGPADTLVNEYSISDKINVAMEPDHKPEVIYYNEDPAQGPTGSIIEIVPNKEADSATGLGSTLTKENITLEDAIKGSFGEEGTSKEFHIVKDKPFDNNEPPVAFATGDPDNGTVMTTKVGRNDNSYICVGFDPEHQDGMLHINSPNSPWEQLGNLFDKYSHLFPSGGGGGGSDGTDGDIPPDDGDDDCGGDRDGGDEY
ncbi:MAG: hypothetical protein KAS90_03300 [Candidatus Aenigmarchaeota archaeon]|nr:hypothetical protein [Candidatus Aenigmarchaeota archaeon]